MNTRTRPRHRTRDWSYENITYCVDYDLTDDILLRANQLVAAMGGELRSICVGHSPPELAKNGGQNTGGGTTNGHLRFAVPQNWRWLPVAIAMSWVPNTLVVHTVNYIEGHKTAFVELQCLICADTRNLRKRLRWWNALLTALATCTAQ